MASGQINKVQLTHGAWETITVDEDHSWTAPNDGVLFVRITQASATEKSYLTLTISTWRSIRINCFSPGYSATDYIPICKGDVIEYSNSGYLSSYLIQFRSTLIA